MHVELHVYIYWYMPVTLHIEVDVDDNLEVEKEELKVCSHNAWKIKHLKSSAIFSIFFYDAKIGRCWKINK